MGANCCFQWNSLFRWYSSSLSFSLSQHPVFFSFFLRWNSKMTNIYSCRNNSSLCFHCRRTKVLNFCLFKPVSMYFGWRHRCTDWHWHYQGLEALYLQRLRSAMFISHLWRWRSSAALVSQWARQDFVRNFDFRVLRQFRGAALGGGHGLFKSLPRFIKETINLLAAIVHVAEH